MYIFLLLLGAILLGIPLLLENKNKKKGARYYILTIGLFFVLIAGLRGVYVGLDTIHYYIFFKYGTAGEFDSVVQESRFEFIFLGISYLVKSLTGSFTVLLFIVAATHIGCVFRMIHKYSSVIWLSCLLFFAYGFYYRDFNELRQAMAIGISCLSFNYLIEGKIKKYIAVIIVASGFHYSALIMLPLFLIKYIKRINLFWGLIIAVAIMIMFSISITLFNYMNTMLVNEFEENDATGGWGLLALQVLILLIGYIHKDELSQSRVNICLFFLIAYSAILFPLCHVNPTMFRLEQYSWIYMAIFLPNLLSFVKWKTERNMEIAFFVLIGLYLSYTNYYTERNQIIPYEFFWE